MLLSAVLLACSPPSASPDSDTDVPGTVPTEPPEVVDAFDSAPDPAVDVLLVVDNSSSMGDRHSLVVSNFPSLWNRLDGEGLDFHVGLIATDVDLHAFSGKLREYEGQRWLDDTTADPTTAFAAMVDQLGILVSSTESGRQATWMAIETQAQFNAGFHREQAELHVIFVSDSDDQTTAPPGLTPSEFGAWTSSLKDPSEWVWLHAVVMPDPVPETCSGSPRPGLTYISYTENTGGLVQSICEADWAPLFDSLALGETGAGQQLQLSEAPDPATLTVQVQGTTYVPCTAEATSGCVDVDEDAATVRLLGVRIPADTPIEVRYRTLP